MEGQDNLLFKGKPRLRHPYMVCGTGGWVDGGESATGSIQYLTKKLGAKEFAEMPVDRFHIFQVPGVPSLRPHVRTKDGILREYRSPRNVFFYWRNRKADNDLILFLGTEPNLNWEEYTNTVLNLAKEFETRRIYLLGGVLDKVPHTREPNVSCLCSSKEVKEEMKKYGVQFSNYEGPGSFATSFIHICKAEDMEVVNFMSRATYYPEFNIHIPRNPKSIRTLIRRLNNLLRLDLDTSDLDGQVREFEDKLEFMASHNPEFRTYIKELEKEYIEVRYEEPLDISADEAVRIAEELIKRSSE